MKFCQSHWNRLRSAIEQHGMEKLIAKSGEAAVERLKKELDGKGDDLSDFDPLMAAHNKIVEEFLKPLGANGLYIMTGDYCPMCELVRLNPRPENVQQIDENWIVGITADLQKFCLAEGLIAAN